jgi:hypothetical protein
MLSKEQIEACAGLHYDHIHRYLSRMRDEFTPEDVIAIMEREIELFKENGGDGVRAAIVAARTML